MRRWEAFALAAEIEAAGTRYRLCGIRLRPARCAGHEVTVKDAGSGTTLCLGSVQEWQEALHRTEIEHLVSRARWAEPDPRLRRDLVAEYHGLCADLGVTAQPVRDPQALRHAMEALLVRVAGAEEAAAPSPPHA
jgi:hypothetical protein